MSGIFIADVFHTIAEAGSIIFDLRRQILPPKTFFELERLIATVLIYPFLTVSLYNIEMF